MNSRALIIAIEDYPNSTSLAQQLSGTNKDAEAFRQWLIDQKKVDPKSILACAGPACAWRTTGTTHDEIVAELLKLAQRWKDENNDELYFYFSGHGFSYEAQKETIQIDVFVASDFVDTDNSGDACLQFQEIQKKLWLSLGPGNHYYFIDACRNPISRDEIEVTNLGKKFPVSSRGRSNYYSLYSTALGQVAKVNSGFTKLLLQGLNGGGKAKEWKEGKMYVTFERLRDYVKAKLKNQEVQAYTGADGDGLILELRPVPVNDCEIKVVNAVSDDVFKLKVSNDLMGDQTHQFQGDSFKVSLKPFDYYLEVTHPAANVVQVDPPPPGPLNLFDPIVVSFQKKSVTRSGRAPALPPQATASREANVTFEAAPNVEVRLVNESSGAAYSVGEDDSGSFSVTGGLTKSLPAGNYVAQVVERGVPIRTTSIKIEPGKDQVHDLLERPKSEVREKILNSLSHSDSSRYADFSETLGPTANWDLSLWLSIFGASHIFSDPRQFSMLRRLPIEDFGDVKKDDSPVYVLAGFEKSEGPFEIALSDGAKVSWERLEKVKTLVGVYEKRINAKPGFHLLSFRIEKQSPMTLAVYCLPNRASFLTFAEDPAGRLKIHQYILPIHRLVNYLDPNVAHYLNPNPLSLVRSMALAQSRFAENGQIDPPDGTQEKEDWKTLMYGKWLDPIMSMIACYEIIRRGQAANNRGMLKIVIENLRRYFPGIPDIEVIARLLGLKAGKLSAPPLLMDGMLAMDDEAENLALPSSKLEYASPWTMWRGAVSESAPRAKRAAGKGSKVTPAKPKAAQVKAAAKKSKVAAAKRKPVKKGK